MNEYKKNINKQVNEINEKIQDIKEEFIKR
jgi:hypothetical protein